MLGYRLIRIDGASMGADLPDQSFAVFSSWGEAQVGDTVLVDHPSYGFIVKRLTSINPSFVRLKGASSVSLSEAQLGSVPRDALRGRLVWQG